MRLLDRVTIITGAASGIGKATASLFATEGAKVIVADINDTAGEQTVNSIQANHGQGVFIHTDVSKAFDVERLIKKSRDIFGKIDVLYNNAGIFFDNMDGAPIDTFEESLWDRIYAVNVKSVFLGAKYVVPEMKKRGGGVIINTASLTGVRPTPRMSAYSSSKGAIITLTKALAIELAPYNIRVNYICPTLTDTPMPKFNSIEEKNATISNYIPLGKMAKPEDIAYAALYLASDESAMLTGTGINVDGGQGI